MYEGLADPVDVVTDGIGYIPRSLGHLFDRRNGLSADGTVGIRRVDEAQVIIRNVDSMGFGGPPQTARLISGQDTAFN